MLICLSRISTSLLQFHLWKFPTRQHDFQSSLGVRKTTPQQSDLFSGDNWILSIWQRVMAGEASVWARCDDSLPDWDTSEVKLRKFHMSMSPQSMSHTYSRKTPWKTWHCKMKLCCEAQLQSKEIHCSNIYRYLGRQISLAKYADTGISLLHHHTASCRNAACNVWFIHGVFLLCVWDSFIAVLI